MSGIYSVIQFSPVAQSCPNLCDPMDCITPGLPVITNSRSSFRLTSIESVMTSNHLILYHPLLLPSIFPSIWVFSNELALCIRWPKYWSFTFSMSPSNEYSVLISFRINWFDLPVVQGTHGSFLKLMSIELVMPSNHLILCCPLLRLPSVFPSIWVFSNEPAFRIRWPKYWSFSFNISPSNEYSGLISFRIDWFDLLAVQGTLKSLLQHHSSKASVLWCSAFLMVQLSHPHMTTGKTIALTRWTFAGKAKVLQLHLTL